MVKRILKIVMLSILSLPLIYFGIYNIQNQTLKRSYVSYNEGQGSDSFIRCNSNVLEPEFANIYFAGDEGHISFKKTKMFFQTNEEWKRSRLGGTTIKNTTFPELVKMVKEDCSQFQDDYNNPDSNGIDWGYREAEPEIIPEPVSELKMAQDRVNELRTLYYYLDDNFREKITEVYGDIETMTDSELSAVIEEDIKDGMNEEIQKAFDEGMEKKMAIDGDEIIGPE